MTVPYLSYHLLYKKLIADLMIIIILVLTLRLFPDNFRYAMFSLRCSSFINVMFPSEKLILCT